MQPFLGFLLSKVYRGNLLAFPDHLVQRAVEQSFADTAYYSKDASWRQVVAAIETNGNELPVFLFRLGAGIYAENPSAGALLNAVHWLMRDCCACEIYYSNRIDVGFSIIHGVGTVIGSRNHIGKGFKIHHGCTIGHRFHGEPGSSIGDNVTMFAHSQIIGKVSIGDNCIIGSNCMVIHDLADGSKCYGPTVAKVGRTDS